MSFLHVDCDLYSATKNHFDSPSVTHLPWDRNSFDEYFNYPGWQNGEFKAFHDFIDDSAYSYEYIGYNRNDEQAAVVITVD